MKDKNYDYNNYYKSFMNIKNEEYNKYNKTIVIIIKIKKFIIVIINAFYEDRR